MRIVAMKSAQRGIFWVFYHHTQWKYFLLGAHAIKSAGWTVKVRYKHARVFCLDCLSHYIPSIGKILKGKSVGLPESTHFDRTQLLGGWLSLIHPFYLTGLCMRPLYSTTMHIWWIKQVDHINIDKNVMQIVAILADLGQKWYISGSVIMHSLGWVPKVTHLSNLHWHKVWYRQKHCARAYSFQKNEALRLLNPNPKTECGRERSEVTVG